VKEPPSFSPFNIAAAITISDMSVSRSWTARDRIGGAALILCLATPHSALTSRWGAKSWAVATT